MSLCLSINAHTGEWVKLLTLSLLNLLFLKCGFLAVAVPISVSVHPCPSASVSQYVTAACLSLCRLSVCLCLSLSVCLYLSVSACLSLPVCLCLSFCQSVYLYVCLSVCQSVYVCLLSSSLLSSCKDKQSESARIDMRRSAFTQTMNLNSLTL